MAVGDYGGYQPALAGADYPVGPIAWQAGQSWPLRLPPRVFAVDMNQQLSSAVAFLSAKPQAKVAQQAAVQAFPNNTQSWVNMDTEIDDAWGMHANSGDSSQVVVPQGCDGLWLVQGVVPYHGSGVGFMYEAVINHQVGGTSTVTGGERMQNWGTGAVPMPWAFDIIPASAGDYFQLGAKQTSGVTVNSAINTAAAQGVQFNHAYYPLLSARWIAANNSLPGGVIGVPFLQGDGTWSAVQNVQLTVPNPSTWTSLEQATSAKFNSDILNNVLFLSNVPVARGDFTNSPAQIPHSVYHQITGLAVQTDNWNAFNTSNSTWTAPVNGVYLIMGQVSYPSQSGAFTDAAQIGATISGVATTWDGAASYGDNVAASVVRQMRLSAGDTIQLNSYQNWGASLTPDGINCRLITVWMSA